MIILGICGFQGSGKDTFANYLVQNYGFVKFSFASAVKDVVSNIFGWDRSLLEGVSDESRKFREMEDVWWSEKLKIPGFTPRDALQQIGTELFRKKLNFEIWTSVIEKKILNELENYGSNAKIVISDCRFPNEISMLKKFNFKLIHIKRNLPQYDWFELYKSGTDCVESSKLHESEIAWIRQVHDFTICNTVENIDVFEEKIRLFVLENFNIISPNVIKHDCT